MKELIEHIKTIEHGFKHIIEAGTSILNDKSQPHLELAQEFLSDESYQVRMLGTYMLGELSTDHPQALKILRTTVAQDPNWRVQEMLAKAFDHYCFSIGYEKSLSTIKEWLSQPNPNTKRAVIEGLRIWTGRPYFKENPQVAITLISEYRENENKYLRNSIGNSLRDIRKKHREVVDHEISHWVNDPRFEYLKKLIQK